MDKRDFDAVVVGSGPNGLAAAITMQREGLSVLLAEARSTAGGGLRTAELTLPGFRHDLFSTILGLGAASPLFSTLPLQEHGLEYLYPEISAAHPFDDGTAGLLTGSVAETAALLGKDEKAYNALMAPLIKDWPELVNDILSPLKIPAHPLTMAKFGLSALPPATYLVKRFKTIQARGLWAGVAAHAIQPLSNMATSAFGLVLMLAAHHSGWPVAKGGSQSLADALLSYFISIGGKLQTNLEVKNLAQLPSSHAVLFDLTPKQVLKIAGDRFSSFYHGQLSRYKYGAGIFKIDWALDGPVPFTSEATRKAGTVHLGNTFEEIEAYESGIWNNNLSHKPFVLLVQQSVFDKTRAPEGKQTVWAYCHVPNGSTKDMTGAIELQVERFAPGFRERILARNTMNSVQLEAYNNNLVGGDINGGVIDITQLYTRPALRFSPYRTSAKGLYICSSSTPPGGGVHGMCGYHAARSVLKDLFHIKAKPL
jgi:phytoene dehydrogenase-like protein